MKKKVEFESLRTGAKFRYKQCLFLKDSQYSAVRISDGTVDPWCSEICDKTLVTPVKVKITVL